MSFTVERIRGGTSDPIKMSIWDAFKGVPNPRPQKPKRCTCCKQFHAQKVSGDSAPSDKKDQEAKNNSDKSDKKSEEKPNEKSDPKTGESQSHSTRVEETYNADDDAKIIAMKTASKSWKEILSAIGKESLSQLKDHWKSIDPSKKANEGTAGEKTDADNETKKTKAEKRQAKIEKDKAEGQAAKKKKQEEEKTGATNTVTEKDSKESANDMKTFASQYDKQKWKAAASKHFDLTGQRITPVTARKMAGV